MTQSRPEIMSATARIFIEMTEDAFDNAYTLLTNHINPNASWACGENNGCMFETYGEELAFVRRQNPRTIWTIVDGEDSDLYVMSGYHFVNRIGYLISTTQVAENTDVLVHIPMDDPDEPEGGG